MTLTNSVWRMCGRLVGGVGPKMKSCYLLRVKQRLAFCCPLLPNKLFSVFREVRLLPGVLVFQKLRRFLQKRHNCAGTVPESHFGDHQVVIFDVTTSHNVTDFLPIASWITTPESLLFSAASRTNQYLRRYLCLIKTRLNSRN